MIADTKFFFHLTTLNSGFMGCNRREKPVTWEDKAFRDFDETIAKMLICENRISYIKSDLFSLDTPWNENWQKIADRAAEFCRLLSRYDTMVFRESTLFLTFPFWRRVLLQCGVKIENIYILLPIVHPFVHFGHLRSQENRGFLFRPTYSYKRSVLEQVNRMYYVFSNMTDEKLIIFFYQSLMHEPDSCIDGLRDFLESSAAAEILIAGIVKEVTPFPDEKISNTKNSVADKLMEILYEFSRFSIYKNYIVHVFEKAQDCQKIVEEKYGSFFQKAAESCCNDAVRNYVFCKNSEQDYESLFETTLKEEETQKL
ncbi:MAG: hypothetical protein E7040_09660 [Lentisphaerae bacterium]|nr:hypothetical protein [Lentisphaerota bacterium]